MSVDKSDPQTQSGNSQGTMERVVEYYDNTLIEYRIVLGIYRNLGIHYPYYDDEHRSYRAASRNMNRALAKRAGIEAGMHVLDAGCGVGGSSIWLAENIGARVTGITLSAKQRRKAEQLAQQHRVDEQIDFLVADYCQTGFADATFDVVWALESCCYADDKRTFLREAGRILKPGGRLIVADGFRSGRDFPPDDEQLLQEWMDGWAVDDLDTPDEFEQSLSVAGFCDLQIEDITTQVMPFSTWIRRRAIVLMPLARVLQGLGIFTKLNIKNGISSIRQYQALQRGLWRYMVFQGRKEPDRS